MTIAELIQKLSELPPQMPVMVAGYEHGYKDLTGPVVKSIVRDVNDPADWHLGPHEEASGSKCVDRGSDAIPAAILE